MLELTAIACIVAAIVAAREGNTILASCAVLSLSMIGVAYVILF